MRIFRNHIHSIFLCILALLLFLVLNITIRSYYHGGFTSDGFHYYSFLRNVGNGYGLWEGPVFEYLLGNHAYLTLVLAAPLVKLFPSPLVLLCLNVACWFGSAWLLFRFTTELTNGEQFARHAASAFIPLLLSILYLVYPITVNGILGYTIYLFQPDAFLPPALVLMAMYFFKGSIRGVCIASVFILWSKEEYVPLVPIVLAWLAFLYYLLHGRIWMRKKDLIAFVLIYLSSVGAALVVMKYYNHLNHYHHVGKIADMPGLQSVPSLIASNLNALLSYFAGMMLPVLIPSLFLFEQKEKMKSLAFFLAGIVAVILGRQIVDLAVYSQARMFIWGHNLIPPLIFISLAISSAHKMRSNSSARRALFPAVLLLSIVISILVNLNLNTAPFYHWEIARSDQREEQDRQLKQIRAAIPLAQRYETFITAEYLMYRFMDRSHAVLSWIDTKDNYKMDVFKKSDYILFPKAGYRVGLPSHRLFFETRDFAVLRRKNDGFGSNKGLD